MKDVDEGEGRYGATDVMKDLKDMARLADRVLSYALEGDEDVFKKAANDMMYSVAVCAAMARLTLDGPLGGGCCPGMDAEKLQMLLDALTRAMGPRREDE